MSMTEQLNVQELHALFAAQLGNSTFPPPSSSRNASSHEGKGKGVRIPSKGPGRLCAASLSQSQVLQNLRTTDIIISSHPRSRNDPKMLDNSYVVCVITSQANEAIRALPNFPEPVKVLDPPAHEIRVHKDFGLGMFATRDLNVGDFIMAERPLFIMARGLGVDAKTLDHALDQMSDKRRDAFFALRNVKGYTRGPIQGIVDTNAIGMSGLPGHPQGAGVLCDEISRINHSCTPNSVWDWHLESFAMEIRALRPIKKGEQIFGSYNNTLDPRDERREFLLRRYKFHCVCPSCALPDDESRTSDARRAKLKLVEKKGPPSGFGYLRFPMWLNGPGSDNEVIDECLEAIELMEKEGVWPRNIWPPIFERLVIAYCCLEDAKNATYWARRASALYTAENSGDDGGWSAVAESPQELQEWWGARKHWR
ncbi:SET domain-containing protein, partial [Panus rudis PR-1116 ss-1]